MPTATVTATSHRQLQTIADTIHSSKRILVVTGAGISTNSGIPDFRSTHGLYNQVKARYPSTVTSNLSQGKDLFDSVLFSDPTTTSIFYTFLAELRNKVLDVPDTTPTHKFIRTLAETGRLLRCYTQNIDGLEGREGLATDLKLGKGTNRKRKRCSLAEISGGEAPSVITAPPRGCQVVQLHGELDTLRCMHCQGKCEYDDEKVQSLMDGMAPDCPSCLEKDKERREKGKRGTRVGGLRPNIVLYGEEHPQGDLIGQISTADISAKPDMMIIFGTSLKVHGLKKLVKAFAASIHARYAPSTTTKKRGDGGSGDDQQQEEIQIPRVIFVNNQPAANSVWKDVIDAWVDMDCDGFVAEVKKRRPAVWERQERI
ncbi:DHS-like NAD/FAD-binding domain-containing protein, partial [Peziza echinospora]